METGGYMFDWRAEAERDGWSLHDGIWHHRLTDEARADSEYVYLGSGTWAETWPHPPRRPVQRRLPAAFDVA